LERAEIAQMQELMRFTQYLGFFDEIFSTEKPFER